MSTEEWPAPPPMPSTWKQNVACRSPMPLALTTAQPQPPPRLGPQTERLLQFIESVT
jgi:hypothetical protein